jgi:asparagine synthetase B (glutamine-hydrolysing)
MFEALRKELEGEKSISDKKSILERLEILLKNAVKTDGKVGIAFSGGVDSSLMALIADKLGMDFILYSVGLENSDDLEHARRLSKKMGWKYREKVYTLEEAEDVIKKVVGIIKDTDTVKVGVGAVVYGVLELAKKDGIKVVLGGLGSEEIFAGYERHHDYKHDFNVVNERLWEGLEGLEERDIRRDEDIAKHFGIELKAPFLDGELVRYAMQIDHKLKINEGEKKIILREVALKMGLEKEYALRKKKAAQYGSKFDRAILRLARKKKFKLKKDYLKSLKVQDV